MKNRVAVLALVALATALGTWIVGWWAVPAVALAAGLLRVSPVTAATAAGLSWAALLLVDVMGGAFAGLGTALSGVMGLPVAFIAFVTIILPTMIAFAAAATGQALVSLMKPASLPDAGLLESRLPAQRRESRTTSARGRPSAPCRAAATA